MKKIEEKVFENFRYDRWSFESENLKQTQTFSVFRPKSVTRPKGTIYFFHAGNTNDRMLLEMETFERMDPETLRILEQEKIQFVTPNFGLNFLLSKKLDPSRAYYEYFFEDVLPRAEKDTDTTDATRFSWGSSLGGHTSLVAFLTRPDRFRGMVSSVGTILNFDFFSDAALDDYVRRESVSVDFAKTLREIFRTSFRSYDEYLSVDPMRLVGQLSPSQLQNKRILLDAGSKDDFAFHVGTTEVSQALDQIGVEHVLEIVPGGKHEPAFLMSRFSSTIRFLLDRPHQDRLKAVPSSSKDFRTTQSDASVV